MISIHYWTYPPDSKRHCPLHHSLSIDAWLPSRRSFISLLYRSGCYKKALEMIAKISFTRLSPKYLLKTRDWKSKLGPQCLRCADEPGGPLPVRLHAVFLDLISSFSNFEFLPFIHLPARTIYGIVDTLAPRKPLRINYRLAEAYIREKAHLKRQ